MPGHEPVGANEGLGFHGPAVPREMVHVGPPAGPGAAGSGDSAGRRYQAR